MRKNDYTRQPHVTLMAALAFFISLCLASVSFAFAACASVRSCLLLVRTAVSGLGASWAGKSAITSLANFEMTMGLAKIVWGAGRGGEHVFEENC